MRDKLYNGDTFERGAYTFKVEYERDEDMGEPWEEHDGHGVVSEWTTRDKAPGERVLVADRSHRRYYDVQASTKLARKDGWGCRHTTATEVDGVRVVNSGHATRGEAIACAVESDFEYLRAWCNDEWAWTSVLVTLLDEDGKSTDIRESLSGIDGDHGDYLTTVAYELADEIIARIEVETPDVLVSEN